MSNKSFATTLVSYLHSHPDKMVTADELAAEFEGVMDRSQIMASMSNTLRNGGEFAKGIVRLKTGAWKYSEVAMSLRSWEGDRLEVEILKETDTHSIVMDENGNVYKLTLLG